MIKPDILTAYADKVYGYAYTRTYSREEAEELSQEILFAALRSLPKLADEAKFEPWLWGIASNVTKSFRRQMGRQRAMYAYDAMPEDTAEDFRDPFENEDEAYGRLREKIAYLSRAYRDIILLHYYDGLGVSEIAERLGLPIGTVTWRLSEARSRIRKEYINMEETALRPQKLHPDIYGTGNYDGDRCPFPSAYINDALSQNICRYCYDEAHTVEDLSKLCGVPAYYIEDRLDNLVKRNAVVSLPNSRFRTDFIIWQDKHGIYGEENGMRVLEKLCQPMTDALLAMAEDCKTLDHCRADYSPEKLVLLYAVLAMEYLYNKYNPLSAKPMEPNYDGFAWRYIASMETGAHPRIRLGRQSCWNLGSRGTYSHTTYSFAGFRWRRMMSDTEINVCEDLITAGATDDRNALALAIENGHIERRGEELFVCSPAFSQDAHKKFCAIAEKHLAPLMPSYAEAVKEYADGFAKLFPAHLADDIARQCRYTFLDLVTLIVKYGQDRGLLYVPAEGETCEAMVQRYHVSVY